VKAVELGSGHHGIGGLEELDQRAGFHQLLVFATAGEKEQGDAHEVLGDGVDARIDPDMGLVRVGQAALSQLSHEQVGGKKEEAVSLRKGGQSRSFPLDQGASGPDETGDSPADKRLHYPSPCMIVSLAHII
jgi:hypothetical protein